MQIILFANGGGGGGAALPPAFVKVIHACQRHRLNHLRTFHDSEPPPIFL